MKAVIIEGFGAPEVMDYRDVPTPEVGPGDVLVEVHAVTVNRLDIEVREEGAWRNPILPLVLGLDPAGVIVEAGAEVPRTRIGERVTCASVIGCGACEPCLTGDRPNACVAWQHLGIHRWGGYAEYICIPARYARPFPPGIGFSEAAVIFRHVPTAFHLLDCKAELKAGETVLIMGASGGLGSAGVQVAKYRGARVIAGAGTAAGVALARELGADETINYRAEDLEARVNEVTGGRGVDVVFENIGAPDLWPAAFNSLRHNGRLVTAGAHGGDGVTLDIKRMYRRQLRLFGGTGFDPWDVDATGACAAEGRLRAPIDRVLPLSEAVEAHRMVSDRVVTGKVVLVPERVLAVRA